MNLKRRVFSALLILLIVFVLFASFYFILHESNHDCSGEECPVCALVAVCRNTLKNFSAALVLYALLRSLAPGIIASVSCRDDHSCFASPVSLKVRLLN